MMNLIKLILLLMPLQAFAGVTPGTIDVRLYDSAGNSITSSGGGLTTSTTISSGSLTCNAGTNLNTSALALDATLTTLSGKFGSLGQQTMAASAPVVIASNQSSIPVTLGANQSVNVAQINGVTPLMGNGVTGTGSQRVTIASDNTPFVIGNSQGSTTSGQSGPLCQAAVTTSSPAYTTAQTSPLSMDTTGALRATLKSAGANGAAIPTIANLHGGTDGTNLQPIAVDTSGNQKVIGSAASLAADSGNPVKVGTVFNTTLPAPTSGNRVDLQSNKFGELVVRHRNKFTNLTGAATTTVKSGTGIFAGFCLNNGTSSSTIKIFDNTAGSGTVIMNINPGSVSQFGSCYTGVDLEFSTGLTVVTTVVSTDVTILYQ